jgi:hypothetical protein
MEMESSLNQTYNNELHGKEKKEFYANLLKIFFFARPYEWISLSSLILLTIITVLKLDGVINWQWKYIFIPLYILLFQLMFIPLSYQIVKLKMNDTLEDELDWDEDRSKDFCGPLFFFFIISLLKKKNSSYFLFPILIAFIFFLILTISQICGKISILWTNIFIPLFLICFWIIALIFFIKEFPTNSIRLYRIFITIGILLLFLFFLFLSLKLDSKINWSWYIIMIPLFIIEFLFIIVPILLDLLTEKEISVFWNMAIIISLLAPLFTFQLLLANHLQNNNHTPYKIIFIPLFILEGYLFIACIFLNCCFTFYNF